MEVTNEARELIVWLRNYAAALEGGVVMPPFEERLRYRAHIRAFLGEAPEPELTTAAIAKS